MSKTEHPLGGKWNSDRHDYPDVITADHVVAANLRNYRRYHKLTLQQMADRLNHYTGKDVKAQTIGEWEYSAERERARPTPAQELVALAAIFDVSVDTLLIAPPELSMQKVRGQDPDKAGSVWLIDTVIGDRQATDAQRFLSLRHIEQEDG